MNGIKIWLVTILMAASIYGLHRFRSVFVLFVIAIVAAYLLNPAVQFFEKHIKSSVLRDEATNKVYRWSAVLIVLLFLFVAVILFFGFIKNQCVMQLLNLMDELPNIKQGIQDILTDVEQYLIARSVPTSILQPVQDFILQIDNYIALATRQVLAWIAGLTTHVLDMVLIIIMLIYFMLDGEKIVAEIHRFLLLHHLNRVSQLIHETHDMVWIYIKTRVIISGCMAAVVFLGLKICSIRYALLFALMSFVLDFIPYFGSIVGTAIITIYVLIIGDWSFAAKMCVFLFAVQQVEGNIVVPKVQGDQMKVHPLLILLALLICNAFWGPIGMLFAVPLAGVAKKVVTLIVAFLVTPTDDVRAFLRGTSEVSLWQDDKTGQITENIENLPTELREEAVEEAPAEDPEGACENEKHDD